LKTRHQVGISSGRLTVYSYRGDHPFKMAHAKNMAHRCGLLEGADILCNLDADNYAGQGFADYIGNISDPKEFLWARMVKDAAGRLPRGISGRIVVTKHQFLNAGGYDEKFETWSPDDKDFLARLGRLGYIAREIPPQFLNAIPHTDKMRFKEYPQMKNYWGQVQLDYDQFHSEIYESDKTIANFGKIGCGTVFRNFDFEHPIELKPLPTRIFGIGMHKTGTTSLNKALKILGYDSAHWKTARWAKRIWEEMTAGGRSRTLEGSYALSDLPIPLLYKELDAAYPGSKFLFTYRDLSKWLESVRRHWDPDINPFRRQWNHDPFTHKVHRLTYGERGFVPEVMTRRYLDHSSQVYDYFRGRDFDWGGKDFLLMHMDQDAGWYKLCAFLDLPIPDVPYPVEFRTVSNA
jgi:Sulfotransferase domain/N-terminal domain of galactosyltransferase